MIDLEELRKIAENATPGPWVADPANAYDTDDHGGFQMQASVRDMNAESITWDDHGGEVFKPADAEFIATFNPETVLALLDRVEKAEQAIARVREQHQVDEYTVGHTIVRCECEEMWPCSTIKALEGDE